VSRSARGVASAVVLVGDRADASAVMQTKPNYRAGVNDGSA